MYFEQLKISLRSMLILSLLTGIFYPLLMTGMSHILFPRQSTGSLMIRDGRTIGSELIGQPFDDPKYFWSRLSMTSGVPCNASSSSGSNLGPTNPVLMKMIQDRIAALHQADPENKELIPVDLVTSSASGLDPHISPAAALYQLKRVARVRGLSESTVENLVRKYTEGRFLRIFGEPRVNVLKLNLALDTLK